MREKSAVSVTSKETRSVCSLCAKEVKAFVVEREGQGVFLEKECPSCGRTSAFLDSDVDLYKRCSAGEHVGTCATFQKLALVITHTCNLSCPMCYLPAQKEDDPSLERLLSIVDRFTGSLIKITGGEPTVREDLPILMRHLRERGRSFALVTNGIRLADIHYLRTLKDAGLKRVALSFSGFSNEAYEKIRGRKLLEIKKRALKNLRKLDIEVVLSVSLVRGVNEGELRKIYQLYIRNMAYIRSLRLRSMSRVGQYLTVEPFTLSEIIGLLAAASGFRSDDIKEAFFLAKPFLFASCRFEVNLLQTFRYAMRTCANPIIYWLTYIRLFGFIRPKKLAHKKIHLRVWPDKDRLDLNEIKKCVTGTATHYDTLIPFCLNNILLDNKKTLSCADGN